MEVERLVVIDINQKEKIENKGSCQIKGFRCYLRGNKVVMKKKNIY